jgi:guanosine-3',5'-bis(diphosphate) 3'-pyrophosphohydrolase
MTQRTAAPEIDAYIDMKAPRIKNDKLLRKAYEFAKRAHQTQKRFSGESFIIHPLNVAKILFEMGFEENVIAVGLLHDTVEDTGVTLEDLTREFGEEIAGLVDGVTNISRIRSENIKQHQAENIRKMLFSMVKDIRVILIKLADKLHNMRTLEWLDDKKAQRISKETVDIYAPLAGRLGMARVKVELEDLALKWIDPEFYKDLKRNIVQQKGKRERYIENFKGILYKEFLEYGIDARIVGRAKHFYSIYQKMKEKDKSFDEVFDLYAIRILCRTVRECYEILGVVHKLWKPVRGRFKDYIAMPKSNMYQSLHTTVIGPEGKAIEVQIRTEQMNIIAEEGIAAHWAYKLGIRNLDGIEKELTWLKKLKGWKESLDNPSGFMEDLQKDLLEEEIYVFTPKGDVMQLPIGSTPIDFAYKIHTEVGHRCIGAKVNGRIIPLRKPLKSCEVVEILTSKNGTPSREWLDVVKSSRARHKIRVFFTQQEEKRDNLKGQESQRAGAKQKPKKQPDDDSGERKTAESWKSSQSAQELGLIAEGEQNVQLRLAQCCTPHPGDDIIGYITRGKGITVHRSDCRNLRALKDYATRKIAVEWTEKTKKAYSLDILSKDRPGLLLDISSAIASSNANIIEMHLKSNIDGFVRGSFRIQIQDEQQRKILLKDLRSIKEIVTIQFR